MTVKELKDLLNKYPDDYKIMVNGDFRPYELDLEDYRFDVNHKEKVVDFYE